jgi:heat shock protein HtpX
MSESILTHAHNIYEQQTHNRRMTWLLLVAFVILITAVGIGFDVFLNISPVARLIILPFVILMVGSGIWNFRQHAAAGLWKEPDAFAEDDDNTLTRLEIHIAISSAFLIIILLIFFNESVHPTKHFISQYIDLPILRYLPIGTTLTVVIGIVTILTSLQWGKKSILWSIHAEQPDEAIADLPELLDVTKEMSLAAGIPCPSVYVVKDSDPNAFTIGTSPMDSSIVVTSGLLAALERDELQGVIAHEMSHIRNSDTRLMTVITILFGAILLLSAWMKKCVLVGGFTGSQLPGIGWFLRGVLFIGWLLTLLLAPIIARIVAMAVSRQREYLADAGGAELTRNPKALANALIKIENASEPTSSFRNSVAHLCVVDPKGRNINNKEGWLANLLATHPPMKNRILLLNAMAYETVTIPEHIAK